MFSLKKVNIKALLREHRDILLFLLVVLAFHLFWKIGREADATDRIIYFYGINFSPFFSMISEQWTALIYHFVHWFKGDVIEWLYCNLHYTDNDTGIRIVWGCSGVKESIMTLLVIVTARGRWKLKLAYIPAGVAFILLLNFIRLTSLTFLVHHHMHWFDFVHGVVFRFVMYGGIFLVWLIWIEKIQIKHRRTETL